MQKEFEMFIRKLSHMKHKSLISKNYTGKEGAFEVRLRATYTGRTYSTFKE